MDIERKENLFSNCYYPYKGTSNFVMRVASKHGKVKKFLISQIDLEKVRALKWNYSNSHNTMVSRVKRGGGGWCIVKLERYIAGFIDIDHRGWAYIPNGAEGKHIKFKDGYSFNCTRENLIFSKIETAWDKIQKARKGREEFEKACNNHRHSL